MRTKRWIPEGREVIVFTFVPKSAIYKLMQIQFISQAAAASQDTSPLVWLYPKFVNGLTFYMAVAMMLHTDMYISFIFLFTLW